MKFNFSNALSSLAALIGVGTLALACSQVPTTSTDESNVGSDEAALTAAQCNYFDVNGSVQICHGIGNGKFKILRTNVQGCVNGHSGHGTDYVTSTNPSSPTYDPTCKGKGCLPLAAPCDATLPCCAGSTCTNGTCVANTPVCPCVFDAAGLSPLGCFPDANGGWVMNSSPVVKVVSGSCSGTNGNTIGITAAQFPVCLNEMLAFDAANWGLCVGSGRDLCTDVPSPLPPIACAVATCHPDQGGFWDYQPLVPAGTTCSTAAGAAGTCSAGGTCVANVVTCPCDGVWNNYLANGVPNPFTSSCTFGPNGANAAYSTATDYGSLGTFTLGGQKTCSVFGTDTTVVRYTRSLSDSEFQACSAVVSAWMTAGGLTSGDCN